MNAIHAIALALALSFTGQAHAWSDKTFLEKGTPLRAKPNEKSKAVATIPRSETVHGATKSIDRDCNYENGFDLFCKVKWRGKTGYVLIEDLYYVGDDFDIF